MKKLFTVLFTFLTVLALVVLSTTAKAEEVLSDEMITNGTFTTNVSGGVVSLNSFQEFAGGDWLEGGHTYLAEDPVTDVCIRMDYAAHDNMYVMCPVETHENDIVKVSLDYMVVGTAVNFGLGFWCTTTSGRTLEHVFATAPTEGWEHAEWEYDAATGDFNYDSMHIWCVGQSEGSQAYIKNFKVTLNDGTDNLITSGDFSAFKNALVSDSAIIGEEADQYLNTGSNARYTGTTVMIAQDGSFAHNRPFEEGKYKVSLDATLSEGASGTISFLSATGTVLATEALTASFTKEMTLEAAATKLVIAATDGSIEIDNLSVKKFEDKAVTFDGWYQSKTTTVNGDFEAFEENTVFSEVQLEGAWGSVNLDAPAHIETMDGDKAFVIATDATHTYSSAFLMLPDTLEVGDVLRLSYDVKLVLESDPSGLVLNSCLVGGSNTSYYTIEIKNLASGNWTNDIKTSGKEKVHYPVKVTALENGWYNLTIDFELTSNDLIQTDSVRWLLSSANNNDKMYIDNVNLYYLTEEEPVYETEVTSVAFADGASVSLKVGDEKTLAVTVLPEDATNKAVTFSSSNEQVATVDASGKVKAVGKGACSITVTSANGKTAEIAIVVTEASSGETPTSETPSTTPAKKGCKSSIGLSIVASIALVGATAIIYKKRREER